MALLFEQPRHDSEQKRQSRAAMLFFGLVAGVAPHTAGSTTQCQADIGVWLRMSVPDRKQTSGMVQCDLAGRTRCLPCPAFEGIREGTNLAVAEQPSNLRDR